MTTERSGKMSDRMREGLIRSLIALAFSPLAIGLGFYLNSYLARDRLEIVHIELIPQLDSYSINDGFRDLVRRSSIYQDFTRYENLRYDSALRLAIDDGQPVTGQDRTPILRELERMIAYLSEAENTHDVAITHLKENNPDSPIPAELTNSQSQGIFVFARPIEDDRERESAIMFLENRLLEIRRIRIQASGERAKAEIYSPSRTGQLQVIAVVLNRGNTDGLVRGRGELVMVDESQTVDLSAYEATRVDSSRSPIVMEPVPRRSVTTLEYWVDVNRSRVEATNLLVAALRNKSNVRVQVRLRDASDRPMLSDFQTLPIGPDS